MLRRLSFVVLFSISALSFNASAQTCQEDVYEASRPATFHEWSNQPSKVVNLPEVDAGQYVVVVGAGASGLAVMRELKARNIAFIGVEAHGDVGGVWNRNNPESPIYKSVRTNSSKATTTLGDDFDEGVPDYPSGDDALGYLKKYAERHGLYDHIVFDSKVVSAYREGDSWRVVIQQGPEGGTYTLPARLLVLATGKHSKSNAEVPADLMRQARASGIETVMHASEYREPDSFRGKRVLIHGMGNTAADIAADLGPVASKVFVAARSSRWLAPMYVFGEPTDVFAKNGPKWLPHKVEMFFFGILQALLVGRPTDLGFETPDHGLMDRLPISDTGISKQIRSGRVIPRTDLVGFEGGKAVFKNPKQPPESVDAVIFATGYKQRFPFLPESFQNFDDGQMRLSFHLFHPSDPGLVRLTEVHVPQGVWPVFEKQAKAVAAYAQAQLDGGESYQRFLSLREAPSPKDKGLIFSREGYDAADADVYGELLVEFAEWILK